MCVCIYIFFFSRIEYVISRSAIGLISLETVIKVFPIGNNFTDLVLVIGEGIWTH